MIKDQMLDDVQVFNFDPQPSMWWAPVAGLRRGRARFAFDHLDVAVWHHLRHGGLAEGQTSMQAKSWIKI